MNKKDLVMLIMAKKTLDYQKDPNPENWRTIKGAKVHIDENGKIDGGAGGKFNGKGALPRSMFSGTGKQTEFAEVTEKKKEIAEREQKEKETQKAERKKERAAAQKTKREEKRKLEKERPELKQKFNDLRESYLKETDPKKKRELRNQALEVSQEYFKKYGNHPDDDRKPKEKKGKSDVGEKGLAYLRSISHVNSSAEEETGYTARTMIDMINKGKTLEEIRTELRKNIDKYSHDADNDYQHLDKMIEAVKRADKGEAKEPKMGAPKSPKKKIDPASTEAQAKRQAIADDVMKRPFVKGEVEKASKKLIAEANKHYGGDHETEVMLEDATNEKDGAYITLNIVAKDKTGKSRFPQSQSLTFKISDLSKEQQKMYFGKAKKYETPADQNKNIMKSRVKSWLRRNEKLSATEENIKQNAGKIRQRYAEFVNNAKEMYEQAKRENGTPTYLQQLKRAYEESQEEANLFNKMYPKE